MLPAAAYSEFRRIGILNPARNEIFNFVERVKTQLRANAVKELQGSLSRAQKLAQYAIADGNPELINTELDAMLAVTPAQIQTAAKKYLTPDKRAVMEIVPAPNPQSGAPGEQKERQ